MADSRKGHLKKRFCGKTGSVLSMLLMTSTFFLVEIVVGYATNSMALVADSFHMLSDMMSLVIGFFALRYSKRSQRTERNTFGWQRAEVLGALVNAVFLIALCFSILVESLKRIVEPELINNPVLVLIVGAIGLLVNVIGLVLFHRHGHGHSHGGHGHSHGQKNGDLDDIQIELPTAKETNPPVETQWGSAEHDTKIARCSAEIHGARSQSTAVKESKTSDLRPAKREAQDEDSVTKISEDDDVDSVTKISEVERVGDVDCKTKNNSGVPKACAAENRTTTNSKIKSSSQLNMRGVYLHVLGDALGSVIVIISALIIKFASGKWTIYVDPVMSILMVLLILKTSVPLMRESALILLQTVPTHIKIKEVQDRLLENVDGVLSVHEFHVWQLAGNKIIASAHVTCQSPDDYMNVANNIKRFFHREGIHSTTIQPEFVVGGRKGSECALECGKGDNCAAQKCCPGENEVRKRTLHGHGLESGFNPEGSVVNLGFVADSA